MPDHLHLFAAFGPRGPSLSRWVQSLKVALAKTLRQRCSGELRSPSGYGSPYWQKGFFDHVLRSAESYAQKWEYVRQNPVRAHLVERPEDWPHQG
jgi:REP element-mobilizing transposase RayT